MFHIISRGNKGDLIFPEDRMKYDFVRLLKEGSHRYQIYVYAFCVMGTHYHLLIQINKVNLSEFMHFIGSSYANYLVRNGWYGHVFSGRFKSILVDGEEYLLVVSRYIHLNPIRALLAKRPEEYKWSSYPLYFRSRQSKAAGWLYRDWLVEYFGPGPRESIKRYREFVESGMEDPSSYPHDKVVANAVLGSRDFIAGIRSKIKCGSRESGWLQTLEIEASKTLDLDGLFSEVCAYLNVPGITAGGARNDRLIDYATSLFVYMAKEFTRSSGVDIACFLHRSPNCISHRYSRIKDLLDADAGVRARLSEDVEKILARSGVDPKRAKGAGYSGEAAVFLV
jgi:putative transposase